MLCKGTDIICQGTDMICQGIDIICQGTDMICQGTNMISCSPYLEQPQHVSQAVAKCIFHGAAIIIVLDVWISTPLQQQLHRFHLRSKAAITTYWGKPDCTGLTATALTLLVSAGLGSKL